MSKTQPARGMRDFLPADIRKRNYVINIIREVYESYGFEPLETPSVENLETLTGKYGEEGNQLIFKILKRGEKLEQELLAGNIKSENELSDLALRYDLTVPLARVVANYKNELPKFFKRYQIQPVWRADRPARGRYREFYQCDVDAIGSSSMIIEAELISAVSEILERLGFEDFVISLNHRKLLSGLLEVAGIPKEKHIDALVILDKAEKIGVQATLEEFDRHNILEAGQVLATFIANVLSITVSPTLGVGKAGVHAVVGDMNRQYNDINLGRITEFISNNQEGNEGLSEIEAILNLITKISGDGKVRVDPSLARGLSYYTGAIFEINVADLAGSLGGGGRYDGLIGMFGKEQIPACGFSLGLERILVVMEERGMFPLELQTNAADVLVTIWNEDSIGESLKLANELRSKKLRVLVYPETDKLGKQFKYASQINVPFVCVLGETELAENKVTLKNMQTGEQETIERAEAATKIKDGAV